MLEELKKLWSGTDKFMLLLITAASVFGILIIASTTQIYETNRYVLVQSGAFILGLIFMFLVMIPDYNSFSPVSKYIYVVAVVFLLSVLLIGTGSEEAGAQSWIRIGPIGIQPSELVKVMFIITFSCHLAQVEDYVNSPFPLLGLLAHAGFLIFLILLQPDYGTSLVYIFMTICMLFTAKISYKYIIGAVCAFVPIGAIMWLFVFKPYQKNRFLDFLYPERDLTGSGYQVVQSKVAIGSGGLAGKGMMHGTLTQSGALPASHTDFIFSAAAEEFGFVGCAIIITLLFVIIFKTLYTARRARTSVGTYMCVGVAAMLLFHVYENIAMCMGLMPVTGIPLPFFSYGGSSILSTLVSMGLVMNVWSRRGTANI